MKMNYHYNEMTANAPANTQLTNMASNDDRTSIVLDVELLALEAAELAACV
jgi:hypothetical protein